MSVPDLEGTFSHEDQLPRVPLPALEDTCARFLAWCGPLLTAEEQTATQRAVESFLQPDSGATTLQAALEEYDATEGVHSWLDAFWPARYLGRRDRIALNANFFFLLQDSDRSQVDRAAGLIAAAVDYKLALDEESVAPVLQQGRPLSMEQTKSLFSATRIPGSPQDTVRAPYSEELPGPSRERHIIVFFRGHLFRMDVIDADGRPLTAAKTDRSTTSWTAAMRTTGSTSPSRTPRSLRAADRSRLRNRVCRRAASVVTTVAYRLKAPMVNTSTAAT